MMTYALRTLICGLVLALTACGSSQSYAVRAPAVTQQVRIGFGAVEVRDVSLPTYAAADEIYTQDAEGTLLSSSKVLWADSPERAIALEMSENLAKLSGRRIASEPWPFEAYPDARLEVRFSELVASTGGQFRASGQYFVGVLSGGRERSGLFDLTVAFDPKGGPAAIAAARGQLILDLATYIARNGLK